MTQSVVTQLNICVLKYSSLYIRTAIESDRILTDDLHCSPLILTYCIQYVPTERMLPETVRSNG